MRTHILTAAVLLLLASCERPVAAPEVKVEDARVQLPPVSGRPGAAYFTLTSNNDPTRLVSVTSPRVERIELHETVTREGVSRMRPISSPAFPDDLELVFSPAGKHAMLFGIDPAVKPGDTIPLTFNFEPAPPVTVEAQVRAFGEGHGGH